MITLKDCPDSYSCRTGTTESQSANLILGIAELHNTLNSQPCQPSDVRVRTAVGRSNTLTTDMSPLG